jgi:5-methylcytosine-specific restriction enzyme subunit McrC
MNLLFEQFVHRLFEKMFAGAMYTVDYQRADRSIIWNADKNQPYSRVIPDLLLQSRQPPYKRLAVDAKYKLYDERKISPGDVYQSFLYAYAFGQEQVEPKSPPMSLIIYPSAVRSHGSVRLRVRSASNLADAEICALGLSIPECLADLRSVRRGSFLAGLREVIQKAIGPVPSAP